MIKEKKEGCNEEMRGLAGCDRALLERSRDGEDGWISKKKRKKKSGREGRAAVFVCHPELLFHALGKNKYINK